MANRKVYSDEQGVFVKHKNKKFRPDNNRKKDTETNRQIKVFESSLSKSKKYVNENDTGKSQVNSGDTVEIQPLNENEINIVLEQENEYWVDETIPNVNEKNIHKFESNDESNSMDFLKTLIS